MNDAMALAPANAADDERIAAAVAAQGPRLRAFVRRRVADLDEAEDIVQEAFLELVSAHRLMAPVDHVAAWLLRVAGNRIIDRFRMGARRGPVLDPVRQADALARWPAPAADGPEARYARELLGKELTAALEELPAEQREVFIAHELEGHSFKELAAATGVGVNTLLGRKHAAVRHLRERLEDQRYEFNDEED
ncbi:MAG TPA: RNA polymerase sigma factor [Steroidobacteraceae bacterium]|nr:RNA polymerase sigma factor [Steroidobacteraceae bacterium]